jgi:methionyl-tRNA synthetase
MKKIFITTTLPYPNAENPHVGFLFEALLADSINRFHKSVGNDTFFNTGLDEEGLKIYQKSRGLGLSPKEYLDVVAPNYINFMKMYHIEYDNFYRTSSDEHSEKVQNIWSKFIDNGDIYKKKYTGKYCIGCESFKLDKELINNLCQDHPNIELENAEEENYFFNLSKYKNKLLQWINTDPLIPHTRYKELIYFINEYNEIPVSRLREKVPWGTIVPNDEEHTVYIWLSALMNYIISADNWIGWNNCEVIQTCGPDNLRFQGQIFQSFCIALGKEFSSKILVHGTILDKDGKKMSKTLGNVIDPVEQLDKWGLDAIRYYCLAGLNTTTDSYWDEEKLVLQFNSDICNDWGNLFSRVMHLVDTKLGGNVNITKNDFTKLVSTKEDQIVSLWHDLKTKDALQKTNELVKFANRYINDEKPWSSENYKEVLSNLYFLLEVVVSLYSYVFPHRADIYEALDSKKKVILFTKIGSK